MRRTVSQIQSASSSHARMLASALSLIAQQGYVHTSTAQVARAAGTSESQLIKHFGSKEGLLEALFETVWSELNIEVERLARKHSDPVNRLKAIVALMLARIAANDEVRRLMLFEGRRIRSRGPAVSKGFVRFVEGLDAVLKEANRAGRFRVGGRTDRDSIPGDGRVRGAVAGPSVGGGPDLSGGLLAKDISRAIDALIGTF